MSQSTTKATKWCAPSEDSDQPGHPPSLIRVFTAWRSIGSLATQWVYSWSESLLARTQVILLVLSCCGSYIFFNFKPYVNHSPISMFLSITTQSQHRLNSVSSQCAHGKSSLARKSEVHPKLFLMVKKTFKKCNPPDLDKLNNKIFPIRCNVNFVSVFTALNNTKKQKKITSHHMGKIFIS